MDIEAVIEIPKGSRNKYEADEHGVIWLDRLLFTATQYPEDYGYVPNTLAADGDPLDVMVLHSGPTFPGCHIVVRPVGMFLMRDEEGIDAKILSVPAHDPEPAARPNSSTSPITSSTRSATFSRFTSPSNPASSPRSPVGAAAAKQRRRSSSAASASGVRPTKPTASR